MNVESIIEESQKKTDRVVIQVPTNIHAEIKARAAIRGITMRKYVLRAIMEMIRKEKTYE